MCYLQGVVSAPPHPRAASPGLSLHSRTVSPTLHSCCTFTIPAPVLPGLSIQLSEKRNNFFSKQNHQLTLHIKGRYLFFLQETALNMPDTTAGLPNKTLGLKERITAKQAGMTSWRSLRFCARHRFSLRCRRREGRPPQSRSEGTASQSKPLFFQELEWKQKGSAVWIRTCIRKRAWSQSACLPKKPAPLKASGMQGQSHKCKCLWRGRWVRARTYPCHPGTSPLSTSNISSNRCTSGLLASTSSFDTVKKNPSPRNPQWTLRISTQKVRLLQNCISPFKLAVLITEIQPQMIDC